MEQGDQAAQPDTSQSTGQRLVWQEVVSCSAPWHTLHTGDSHHNPASVSSTHLLPVWARRRTLVPRPPQLIEHSAQAPHSVQLQPRLNTPPPSPPCPS